MCLCVSVCVMVDVNSSLPSLTSLLSLSLSLLSQSVQSAQDMWQKNLAQLEQQYRITNPLLLIKSASVLIVVILLFFLANVIPGVDLELGTLHHHVA